VEIKCSQCGAGIEISSESGFISCPYCDSRLYVETDRTIQHFYLKPGLKPEQIPGIISRELSKLELTESASVIESKLIYVPFWLIKLKDQTLRFPAGKLELAELKNFSFPVGALAPFEPELALSGEVEIPELDLDQLMNHPKLEKLKDEVLNSELVHIPFFRVDYTYQGQRYTAMIDAGAGKLYADKLPVSAGREKDRYFLIRFGILSLVFLLEAFLIPGKHFWVQIIVYVLTCGIAWYFIQAELKRLGY